jgi:hypothetical protein
LFLFIIFKNIIDKVRKKEKIKRFFIYIKKFVLESIPVIEPDSAFKIIWDFILISLIVINIFYIPMKLSFGFDAKNS